MGVFHGYKKPYCANIFLSEFIDEMKNLDKIVINGKEIQVTIRSFICVAPARSFILGKLNLNNYTYSLISF